MCSCINDQTSPSGYRSTIDHYFDTLNQGQFHKTAALFSLEGTLYPPVEDPIVGRSAIETYLHSEASGQQVEPLSHQCHSLPNGQTYVSVQSWVRICPFGINVVWIFRLNSQGEIDHLHIELMPSCEQAPGSPGNE